MSTKVLLSIFVLVSLLASCNLPVGQSSTGQPSGNEDVSLDASAIGTAVALTSIAQLTESANSGATAMPTLTPMPTSTLDVSVPVSGPCTPMVTATVNANVRLGPGTAYDIVGALTLGQSAAIVGRNDAYTWWYIDYPGAAGNHAWIAGSVVTGSCVPAEVQVVAAPPLPTAVTADNDSSSNADGEGDGSGSEGGSSSDMPDLAPVGMSISPNPATQGQVVHVHVGVKNLGNAPSGAFSIYWYAAHGNLACHWTVASLAPGESVNKSCTYTYAGWNNSYDLLLVIDAGNSVTESNEGNNRMARTLKVQPAP